MTMNHASVPIPGYRTIGWEYLFICGPKRSGTTLFSSLCDGHPQIFVFPGEFQVFGRHALGTFHPGRTYPVRELAQGVLWYLDMLESGNTDACSFDTHAVRAALEKENNTAMDRFSFFEWFCSLCVDHSSYRGKHPKYVVIKTMYNGVDFGDARVSSCKKIITHRPFDLLFKSYRTKLIKKRGLPKYRLLGNLFFQHYEKAAAQEELVRITSQDEASMHIALSELQEAPERIMRAVSGWLGILYDPILIAPTFNGKTFAGHFYDKEKNTGRVEKKTSAHEELLPLEQWALLTLKKNDPRMEAPAFRERIGLPGMVVMETLLSYFSPAVRTLGITLTDLFAHVFVALKKKSWKPILRLPLSLLELLYRHCVFFFCVLSKKFTMETNKQWGLYAGPWLEMQIKK